MKRLKPQPRGRAIVAAVCAGCCLGAGLGVSFCTAIAATRTPAPADVRASERAATTASERAATTAADDAATTAADDAATTAAEHAANAANADNVVTAAPVAEHVAAATASPVAAAGGSDDFAGLDPASDLLRPHHSGDSALKPVRFSAPLSGRLPQLPSAAQTAEWRRAAQEWAGTAQPGDYPMPLTTGMVAAALCPGRSRFGGSHDSKSPTGWVVCDSGLPAAKRFTQARPNPRTLTYSGDCRNGPGGTCLPRPKASRGPDGGLQAAAADSCVVYSFGVGEEDSFEQHVAYDTGCEVHAFDPVPAVKDWVAARDVAAQVLRSGPKAQDVERAMSRILEAQGARRSGTGWWRTPLNGGYYVNMAAQNKDNPVVFHPWGLSANDGEEKSMTNSWSRGESQRATFRTISSIMKELGHTRVDLVKIDIEGYEWSVLSQLLDPALQIGQLLTELHFGGAGQWVSALAAARAAGFVPFHAEKLRYHGRGCRKSRIDPKCRGALQEVSFIRDWS